MTDLPYIPDTCPECGSDLLVWSFGQRTSSGSNPHALSVHQVIPFLCLGCEECSETLVRIEDEQHLNQLLRSR